MHVLAYKLPILLLTCMEVLLHTITLLNEKKTILTYSICHYFNNTAITPVGTYSWSLEHDNEQAVHVNTAR